MLKKYVCFVTTLLFLEGCTADKQVSRSFYFWKQEFTLDAQEAGMLKALGNHRIYLHVFDVDWDKPSKSIVLRSRVNIGQGQLPDNIEIVPVIAISPLLTTQLNKSQIESCAALIIDSLNVLLNTAGLTCSEIQVDCDWTDAGRESYFSMLTYLKASLNPINQQLSCTIRLHQVKYPDQTGVPPVDRAMLMYYNMVRPDEPGTRNSIYDPDIAARYVTYAKDYHLPLDIALPVFTWGVHQRSSSIISFINNLTLEETRASGLFYEKAKGLFVPQEDCYFKGSYFKVTDRLRVEEISPQRCLRAARQVQPFLNSSDFHVALFHLDSANTVRYGQESFEELYSVFE